MKKSILILLVGLVLGAASISLYSALLPYQQKRERIIREMELTINQMVETGEYRCCIEPACDMCFLGHWLWDDGICRCDDMIAKGEMDKVCPQCVKGIEKGQCKSTIENESYCEVE